MQLFADNVKDEDGEVPRANFNNFPVSCLSLFQVMTGEVSKCLIFRHFVLIVPSIVGLDHNYVRYDAMV